MTDLPFQQVFLAYAEENLDIVEALARRLKGDARLTFWFAPWHSVPGQERQQQMEKALRQAQACAVFISTAQINSWQNAQMRSAIQMQVEDKAKAGFRVIPVLLPGVAKPLLSDLPPFLQLFEPVEFHNMDDDRAFKRLLAGILGVPPIEIEGYIATEVRKEQLSPPSGKFDHGHALVIGIAGYQQISHLPETVLNDARAIYDELTSSAGGYDSIKVTLLLNEKATGVAIRTALTDLAARTSSNDTVIVFFSGHGAHNPQGEGTQQYILPYDCVPFNLQNTSIAGDEMTALLRTIKAGRLLVLFDSCHSGGAGEPKGGLLGMKNGLSENYYQALARGQGRVVIASSRPDELSWVLPGMGNSLFTHYLLEALRGQGPTLGDGYVRVFDLFRHVANYVPRQAPQHPIFKVAQMEDDFPVAFRNTQLTKS